MPVFKRIRPVFSEEFQEIRDYLAKLEISIYDFSLSVDEELVKLAERVKKLEDSNGNN